MQAVRGDTRRLIRRLKSHFQTSKFRKDDGTLFCDEGCIQGDVCVQLRRLVMRARHVPVSHMEQARGIMREELEAAGFPDVRSYGHDGMRAGF